MKLFDVVKTMLQSLTRCFKRKGVVKTIKNHKTDIAGDDGLHLLEEIKTDTAGDDVKLLLPAEIETDIAGDVELHLPEKIIQRIQSFLNGKEAARTALVSKLWRSAWSTRPNLDFDEFDIQQSNEVPNLEAVEQMLQFAKKTMQRYDDLNLNIETFRLHINSVLFDNEERESRYLASVANDLLEKAMKLGAVGLDFNLWNWNFVLPDSVLQSESLATLSVRGFFKFDFKRLTCSNIKSLSLSLVHVDVEALSDSDEFPNLEYMYLHYFFTEGSLLDNASFFTRFSSLKELVFTDCFDSRNIQICSKSLERITMTASSNQDGMVTSAEFDVPNLRRFEFRGGHGWTRLAFKATCREWESDIVLYSSVANHINVDWFINLNKLLTDLSMSTSVSLNIYVSDKCSGLVETAGLPTPRVVKELTLKYYDSSSNTSFLENFFLICRPKLMILEKYDSGRELMEKYLLEMICKGIVEEVKVEVWIRASHEWPCVPLNHRLHANDVDDNSKRLMFENALKTFRFQTLRVQLRWGIWSLVNPNHTLNK